MVGTVMSDGLNGSFSWWYWHWHPDLYGGLLLFVGIYLLCVGPFRTWFIKGEDQGASYWQVTSFITGAVIILFALAGPVHELSDNYLFSAHMAQHMLVTLVAPPLLLLGTPGWLLRPIVRVKVVLRMGKFLTKPLIAFFFFLSVFSIWHLPVLYDGALRSHTFHVAEHLLFMMSAVILWWPIMSPLPELPQISSPAKLLYLILVSIAQTGLFAVITFSDRVIYVYYESLPRLWGLSPLVDQQIGGIVMKVTWLAVFVPGICIVFLVWFNREERNDSRMVKNSNVSGRSEDG